MIVQFAELADVNGPKYKPFLLAFSKYKAKELEVIAGQEGIALVNEEGKKKIKKQLYDEINLKHYIQDI